MPTWQKTRVGGLLSITLVSFYMYYLVDYNVIGQSLIDENDFLTTQNKLEDKNRCCVVEQK